MHKKESQKPPEYTSEHVKSQNFLGAYPQTPLTQSTAWAPLFVFALGPHNPLGGPVWEHDYIWIASTMGSRKCSYDVFITQYVTVLALGY